MSKLTLAMAAAVMRLVSPYKQIAAFAPLCSEKFASHCLEYQPAFLGPEGISRVAYIQALRASCACDSAARQITG
jgi:hypothetical protein